MLMDLSRSRAHTQLNSTTRYVARSVGRYVSQLVGLHHFTRAYARARVRACKRVYVHMCVHACVCVCVCEHVRVSGTTSHPRRYCDSVISVFSLFIPSVVLPCDDSL